MSTSIQKSNELTIEMAKKHFRSFALDEAFEVVNQSLEAQSKKTKSDSFLKETLLWSEILLAKGRFSNNETFLSLAYTALSDIKPSMTYDDNDLSYYLLLAKTSYFLDPAESRTVYKEILEASEKNDSLIGQIQALNGLSKLTFIEGDLEQAIDLANQSLELLIQETDEAHLFALAENHILLSAIYLEKLDLEQAKNYAERALKTCQGENLKEIEIEAQLLLAKTYIKQRNYTDAIQYLLEGKKNSQNIKHEVLLSQIILYIGILYNEVFHYAKALENHNLLQEEYFEYLSVSDRILLLNYLAKSYFLSFQNELATECFEKAIILAKKHNNKAALVFAYAYLGRIQARHKDTKKALLYAKRTNDILEQIGDANGKQVNLLNLGDVHFQLGKLNEGIKLTSRGVAAAKRMKDGLSEIWGYQIMAEIFRKKKDYKSAVMYQMIYTKFYEDFYQRNDRQKVLEVEHQFMIRQLEEKIERLQGQ